MNFLTLYRNKIIKCLILLFLLSMILFPVAAFQGASSGLLLWFHNVMPNLLPFVILSNLMIRLNITRQLSRVLHPILGRLFFISNEGCYPIAIGFLSGIPMGAKSTADLVYENKISHKEGQFLLGMCNNASPMFILGYIAITQLKLPHIKYALFVMIYGSAILGALIWRFFKNRLPKTISSKGSLSAVEMKKHKSFYPVTPHEATLINQPSTTVAVNKKGSGRFSFDLLDTSIMNGFEVVTKVGGYIILFSILSQIIKEAGPDMGMLKPVLMGLVEITIGISQICNSAISDNIKIVLVTVITAFGGFSGMAQTKSVLGDSRLSIFSYFIVKLISALIALIFALLYVSLF